MNKIITLLTLLITLTAPIHAVTLEDFCRQIYEYQKSNSEILIKSKVTDDSGSAFKSEEYHGTDEYYGKFWINKPIRAYYEAYYDKSSGKYLTYLPVTDVLLEETNEQHLALRKATQWGKPTDLDLLRKYFEVTLENIDSEYKELVLRPKPSAAEIESVGPSLIEARLRHNNDGMPISAKLVTDGATSEFDLEIVTENLDQWEKVKKTDLKPSDQSFYTALLKEMLFSKFGKKKNKEIK